MNTIVITVPHFLPQEAELSAMLLDEGIQRLHLRKPDSQETQMRQLIESIPTRYYPRITLQDHLSLAAEYGLGGVHLNRRNPLPPQDFDGLKSRSSHSLQEVARFDGEFDYQFLSPIFDSISKQGYSSTFTPTVLQQAFTEGVINRRIIALGGITPDNLPLVARWGFGGAAFLGYIWQSGNLREMRERTRKIIAISRQSETLYPCCNS